MLGTNSIHTFMDSNGITFKHLDIFRSSRSTYAEAVTGSTYAEVVAAHMLVSHLTFYIGGYARVMYHIPVVHYMK